MSAFDTRDMLEGWETNAAALPTANNDKVKWLGASENNPIVIERVHVNLPVRFQILKYK